MITEYDDQNRLAKIRLLNNKDLSFKYDSAGNVIEFIDSEIGTYKYEYDLFGRQIKVIFFSEKHVSFHYDPVGNRIKMFDTAGKAISYSYNKNNLLTSISILRKRW